MTFKGFYVFVQNASDYPLGVDRAPYLVSANMHFKLSIQKRQFFTQHPEPYSHCSVVQQQQQQQQLENSERNRLADAGRLFDRVVAASRRYAATYTRTTCMTTFCTQLLIGRICGCNSKRGGGGGGEGGESRVVDQVAECSLEQELDCVERVLEIQTRGGGNGANQQMTQFCLDRCPLECSRSTFDVNVYQNYLSDSSNDSLVQLEREREFTLLS